MAEIGETLRDARMRARIDVSEIEAKTKIRAKYLRALENEEWGLLPGPTFVKSFLRTYAQALDLDGKALVEQYRLQEEDPGEAALEPIVSRPERGRTRGGSSSRGAGAGRSSGGGPSRAYLAIVGAVVLVIALLIYGLASGGGGSGSKSTAGRTPAESSKQKAAKHKSTHGSTAAHHSTSTIVALSLRPSAAVYVCLIGDNGRKVIAGEELQPGKKTPTYHARRFQITLGNSSVTMYVDGHAHSVPASSKAIGYTITRANGRKRLHSGELPTCT
ncbi:MAG TPA: helix-turn-helix domain-containing protein [Solirubrobacteraceae bacterium]|jgi:cytoskeleton protein RodZ|nr:helix-turn-helix domain-containing protein [Solirubrobacteraceae bacterium]